MLVCLATRKLARVNPKVGNRPDGGKTIGLLANWRVDYFNPGGIKNPDIPGNRRISSWQVDACRGNVFPGPSRKNSTRAYSTTGRRLFRLLKLLQAESRLLDLLMEDLSGFDDATIGASVRGVHAKARKILRDTVEMVPIISGNEGDSSRVEPGFDPAAIRLVGAVSGLPPFEGRICHPGWRVKSHKIPVAQPGASGLVLEQAEIELT